MKTKKNAANMPGIESGRVTRRNVRHGPAPSRLRLQGAGVELFDADEHRQRRPWCPDVRQHHDHRDLVIEQEVEWLVDEAEADEKS